MAKTGVVKISPPSDFAKPTGELHDLDRAELMTIAQLGWKCLVRHDLLEAKSQLDHNQISGELKPIPFHWWNQTRPELKRQLIDDDDLYNALESFSTALNDRNDRTTLPLDLITDFHIYHKACLVRYEILKRMGFV